MQLVCKKELNGENPYSTKILLIITSIFLGIGFLYLTVYKNTTIKYFLTGMLFLIIIFNRHRAIKYVQQLMIDIKTIYIYFI